MTADLKIEKDVPIPDGRRQSPIGVYQRALKTMQPGDSFVIPVAGQDQLLTKQNTVLRTARSMGKVIKTRKVSSEAGDVAVRVWLIS